MLKATLEVSAAAFQSQLNVERWADLIDPQPTETRTGAQIAADVIKGAGLILESDLNGNGSV